MAMAEGLKICSPRSLMTFFWAMAMWLVQPLGFWILLGLGFHGTFVIPGAEDVSYIEYLYPGIITLILLFTAIFSTISVVLERQQGFLQAALVAPVPRSVIVFGLVSGGATLAVAEAALFLLLAPLAGFSPREIRESCRVARP